MPDVKNARIAAVLTVAFLAGTALADSKAAVDDVEVRLRANDVDGAIAAGERETRLSPNDATLWIALGEAYGAKASKASVLSRIGYAKKCKAAFETAVRVDPKNVDAREDLFTYDLEAPGIAGGSVALAQDQATEIARLDAGRGHLALAAIAEHSKDAKVAETEYTLAIEAAPDQASRAAAQWRLGLLYEKLGRKADAVAAWKESLRLDPGFEDAKRELKRVGA